MTGEDETRTEEQKANPSGTTLCSIAYRASTIGQDAHAAYWLEAEGVSIDFHRNRLREELVELASLFGAAITFLEEADQ